MNLKEYARDAKRTAAMLKTETMDDLHMVLGMVTEVAELADVYKKYIAYGKDLDFINIQEEIGDLMWYIINFCTFNNFNLEKILQNNIDKLKSRYPEKFTEHNANHRNLEKEREVLEQ
ncbi:unnamed protein product [marine sediment metagenome]|uniref:NTP pyrophosphohydrolase MazG-like domain-containing protein n=1 Tax=marine sediment metagenome TaxID=412755 RepID=X0ZIA3_9ZZZZ